MNQSPSHSTLEASAAYLRGLFAVMWSGLGVFSETLDPWRAIDAWIQGIFHRLEAMLLQFQAGKLVACDQVRPIGDVQAAPSRAAGAPERARNCGVVLRVSRSLTDAAPVMRPRAARLRGTCRAVLWPEPMRLPLPRGVMLAAERRFFAKMALLRARRHLP